MKTTFRRYFKWRKTAMIWMTNQRITALTRVPMEPEITVRTILRIIPRTAQRTAARMAQRIIARTALKTAKTAIIIKKQRTCMGPPRQLGCGGLPFIAEKGRSSYPVSKKRDGPSEPVWISESQNHRRYLCFRLFP